MDFAFFIRIYIFASTKPRTMRFNDALIKININGGGYTSYSTPCLHHVDVEILIENSL